MLLTFLPMSLVSAVRLAGSWSPGATFRGQDSHYSPFLPARTLQWKRPACRQASGPVPAILGQVWRPQDERVRPRRRERRRPVSRLQL